MLLGVFGEVGFDAMSGSSAEIDYIIKRGEKKGRGS
jgi:hypothetical protein